MAFSPVTAPLAAPSARLPATKQVRCSMCAWKKSLPAAHDQSWPRGVPAGVRGSGFALCASTAPPCWPASKHGHGTPPVYCPARILRLWTNEVSYVSMRSCIGVFLLTLGGCPRTGSRLPRCAPGAWPCRPWQPPTSRGTCPSCGPSESTPAHAPANTDDCRVRGSAQHRHSTVLISCTGSADHCQTQEG